MPLCAYVHVPRYGENEGDATRDLAPLYREKYLIVPSLISIRLYRERARERVDRRARLLSEGSGRFGVKRDTNDSPRAPRNAIRTRSPEFARDTRARGTRFLPNCSLIFLNKYHATSRYFENRVPRIRLSAVVRAALRASTLNFARRTRAISRGCGVKRHK